MIVFLDNVCYNSYMKYKYIKEYNKSYLIYENGKVVSLPRKLWNGVNYWESKKRELKPAIAKIGYKVIVLTDANGNPKMKYIHRLIAQHFIYNPLNKKQVNHKDGNKLNNKISNLEWVTQKENIRHAFKNKLMKAPSGEKSGKSKFNEQQIREIKKLKGIEKLRITAKKFNTNTSNVWFIQNNKTWVNIKI